VKRKFPEKNKLTKQNKTKHPTTSGNLDLEDFSLIGLVKQDKSLSLLGIMEIIDL